MVVALAALAVGGLRGGSLRRLGQLRLRRSWLLVLAVLAPPLAGAGGSGPAYAVGLAVSAGAVGVVVLANRQLPGMGLVALGLLANAAVSSANGAMPVSLTAAVRAGADVDDVLLGRDPRHELATPDTRLPLLGDVVPVPLPLRPEVVSPGDLLVAAGLGGLLVVSTTGRGLRQRGRWEAGRRASERGTGMRQNRRRP